MTSFRLAVFDMAGTTVTDRNEVRECFIQAAHNTGLARTVPAVTGLVET